MSWILLSCVMSSSFFLFFFITVEVVEVEPPFLIRSISGVSLEFNLNWNRLKPMVFIAGLPTWDRRCRRARPMERGNSSTPICPWDQICILISLWQNWEKASSKTEKLNVVRLKILASWDYYSQYMESHNPNVPKHQPVIFNVLEKVHNHRWSHGQPRRAHKAKTSRWFISSFLPWGNTPSSMENS